jgi:hypothetical protein
MKRIVVFCVNKLRSLRRVIDRKGRMQYLFTIPLLRVFGAAIISLALAAVAISQVKIQEKVTINPSGLRSNNVSTTVSGGTGKLITVTLTYRACGGYKTIYIGASPCNNAYQGEAQGNEVFGNRDPSEVGQAVLAFVAYDYGGYGFSVRDFTTPCIVSSTCDNSHCEESASITVNGVRYPGAGYSYFNTSTNECTGTDLQPQTFDPASIEKYREGQSFDPRDGGLSYIVTGCQVKRSREVQGITFIPPGMPFGLPPPYNWNPVINIGLNACKNQNKLVIKVENLRIPIFALSCIDGYIDLGDGCDQSILSREITSKNLYEILLYDLKWWMKGPSSHLDDGTHPTRFAFRTGVEAHEDLHFSRDSADVAKKITKAYEDIFNLNIPVSPTSCIKEIVTGVEANVKDKLSKAIDNTSKRWGKLRDTEKQKEQKDADIKAGFEYERILTCIMNWVATQPWYNN